MPPQPLVLSTPASSAFSVRLPAVHIIVPEKNEADCQALQVSVSGVAVNGSVLTGAVFQRALLCHLRHAPSPFAGNIRRPTETDKPLPDGLRRLRSKQKGSRP